MNEIFSLYTKLPGMTVCPVIPGSCFCMIVSTLRAVGNHTSRYLLKAPQPWICSGDHTSDLTVEELIPNCFPTARSCNKCRTGNWMLKFSGFKNENESVPQTPMSVHWE